MLPDFINRVIEVPRFANIDTYFLLLLEFFYLRRERKCVPWHTCVPWKSVPWHTFPYIKVLHYFLKKHCWITPNNLVYHESLFLVRKIRRRYSQTNQVFDDESSKYGEFTLNFSENRCFLLYTTEVHLVRRVHKRKCYTPARRCGNAGKASGES